MDNNSIAGSMDASSAMSAVPHIGEGDIPLISDVVVGLSPSSSGSIPFKDRIQALIRYREQHGNFSISPSFSSSGIGEKDLGSWVAAQRSSFRTNTLPNEHVDTLNSIGFTWDSPEARKAFPPTSGWAIRIAALLRYKEKHGNLLVPAVWSGEGPGEHNLGFWVSRQRVAASSDSLNPERRNSLDEIGFVWKSKEDAPPPISWKTRVEALKRYKEKHGHSFVPYKFTGDGVGEKCLGHWVCDQRKTRKNGKLSDEKIRILDELEFVWEAPRRGMGAFKWDERFEALKRFRAVHSHCLVAQNWTGDGHAEKNLGKWVSKQRANKKNGKLKPRQLELLNSIDFYWEASRGGANAQLMSSEISRSPGGKGKAITTIFTDPGGLPKVKKARTESHVPPDHHVETLTHLEFLVPDIPDIVMDAGTAAAMSSNASSFPVLPVSHIPGLPDSASMPVMQGTTTAAASSIVSQPPSVPGVVGRAPNLSSVPSVVSGLPDSASMPVMPDVGPAPSIVSQQSSVTPPQPPPSMVELPSVVPVPGVAEQHVVPSPSAPPRMPTSVPPPTAMVPPRMAPAPTTETSSSIEVPSGAAVLGHPLVHSSATDPSSPSVAPPQQHMPSSTGHVVQSPPASMILPEGPSPSGVATVPTGVPGIPNIPRVVSDLPSMTGTVVQMSRMMPGVVHEQRVDMTLPPSHASAPQ